MDEVILNFATDRTMKIRYDHEADHAIIDVGFSEINVNFGTPEIKVHSDNDFEVKVS